MYDSCYTTKRLYTSLHNEYQECRCPDLWLKTAFYCEMTKKAIKGKERRIGAKVRSLPSANVACGIQTVFYVFSSHPVFYIAVYFLAIIF